MDQIQKNNPFIDIIKQYSKVKEMTFPAKKKLNLKGKCYFILTGIVEKKETIFSKNILSFYGAGSLIDFSNLYENNNFVSYQALSDVVVYRISKKDIDFVLSLATTKPILLQLMNAETSHTHLRNQMMMIDTKHRLIHCFQNLNTLLSTEKNDFFYLPKEITMTKLKNYTGLSTTMLYKSLHELRETHAISRHKDGLKIDLSMLKKLNNFAKIS
ncbi:Crp/Fnr family transcriptional regulator [Listeria ilorinensis]|uniref:Crp/Fnr family transcriptional regulator n=1 Tax=Listeria ilorinensis TaxID=2867439 RepID=UPI001EF5E326|nr:Crp/Fnr family transcriptional regulator [Listeria ilorinensis]